MRKEYRIGAYVFSTYEEYSDGLDDVNTIRYIVDNVDMEDMDVLLHLYDWVKNGKLEFKSPIGEAFFMDIVERVASQSQQQLEVDKKVENKKEKTDHLRKFGGMVCVMAAIICFAIYFGMEYSNYKGKKEIDHLQDLKKTAAESPTTTLEKKGGVADEEESAGEESNENQEKTLEILPEYQAIYQENQDFVGWLTIPDTIVDYPVMQSKNDSEYYLDHTFSGEEDKNGTLFIDNRNNIEERSTNIIIYGHNMKSNAMFGSLKKYLDENYWKQHKTLQFDTIYEKGTYEITAVCLGKVEYQDENVFRYYDFLNADNKKDFKAFKKNVQESAVLSDENPVKYGDELLTLSTCNHYVENGRLYIVARKLKS